MRHHNCVMSVVLTGIVAINDDDDDDGVLRVSRIADSLLFRVAHYQTGTKC